MTAIGSYYIMALKETWRLRKLVLFLLIMNILFALVVALPLNFLLKNRISHSQLFSESIGQFDFNFIGDMMNNKGAELMMILNQSYWVVLMFLILSIFFVGGIVDHVVQHKEKFNVYQFVQKGVEFFWRYLRLSLFFIVAQIALLVAAWSIFNFMLGGLSPFDLKSDTQIINTFYWVIPVYLICATIILMIQDYAKIFIHNSSSAFITTSIWKSIIFCLKHFIRSFPLYLLFILTLIITYILFNYLNSAMLSNTLLLIILSFVLSQIFIFLRVFIRIANLSAVHYFSEKSL